MHQLKARSIPFLPYTTNTMGALGAGYLVISQFFLQANVLIFDMSFEEKIVDYALPIFHHLLKTLIR